MIIIIISCVTCKFQFIHQRLRNTHLTLYVHASAFVPVYAITKLQSYKFRRFSICITVSEILDLRNVDFCFNLGPDVEEVDLLLVQSQLPYHVEHVGQGPDQREGPLLLHFKVQTDYVF